MSCSKTLHWHELIPVFSDILQRGKCRGCRAKFSWQYPAVEIVTGIVFVLIFRQLIVSDLSFASTLYAISYKLIIASILIVITVYDLRHKIIPDGFVYAFDLLALITVFLNHSYEQFVVGIILFLFLGSFWLFSGGRWMGLGDAKLALGIGWFLPFPQNITSIIVAFWIGAVVGILLLMAKRKRFTLKTEIPFAPFLVLGFFLTYFLGLNIL
jgi:leader peptidase (prepilin peptidase)/N-methyltransferase